MTDLHHHIENAHASSGRYIKNIVYGGLDGIIITTFSIAAASYGANFEMKMIIIMGVANLIADGFSGLVIFLVVILKIYIYCQKNKKKRTNIFIIKNMK